MEALSALGYRVTGPNHVHDKDIAGKFERVAAELSHRFDAFQDHPWPLVYPADGRVAPRVEVHPDGARRAEVVRQLPQPFRGQANPDAVLFYGPAGRAPKGQPPTLNKGRMRRKIERSGNTSATGPTTCSSSTSPAIRDGSRSARSWGCRFPTIHFRIPIPKYTLSILAEGVRC